MPSDLPKYVTSNSSEWAVVKENRKSARFRNLSKGLTTILIVRVDGGMIQSGARADFIVVHPQLVDVVVELKGSDVAKAIQQIRATLPLWKQHRLAGKTHAALIVRGQGVHLKATLRTEALAKKFRDEFKMKLLIETRNRDYEFAEFLPEKS
jgi:hypothetical protein